MVQDGVQWFGQIATKRIRVGNGRFTPGDLIVGQTVATASDAISANGTALVLRNFSLSSLTATFEVDLPITGTNAMITGANPFTGMIDLSTDKNYIVVGGYHTNAPYRPAGANVSVDAPLLAIRPDGTNVELPAIRLRVEGKRYRFLPNGLALVYAQGPFPAQDFWLLDLATKKSRQLSRLNNSAATQSFDVTADGKQIVFDRVRENSDVVLIDVAR